MPSCVFISLDLFFSSLLTSPTLFPTHFFCFIYFSTHLFVFLFIHFPPLPPPACLLLLLLSMYICGVFNLNFGRYFPVFSGIPRLPDPPRRGKNPCPRGRDVTGAAPPRAAFPRAAAPPLSRWREACPAAAAVRAMWPGRARLHVSHRRSGSAAGSDPHRDRPDPTAQYGAARPTRGGIAGPGGRGGRRFSAACRKGPKASGPRRHLPGGPWPGPGGAGRLGEGLWRGEGSGTRGLFRGMVGGLGR